MEKEKALQAFKESFGAEAEDLFTAAGRINVIGEHVDYCGGKVFPAALNLRCNVYARKRGGNTIRMAFRGIDGIVELDTAKLGDYKGLKIGNFRQAWRTFYSKRAWKSLGAICITIVQYPLVVDFPLQLQLRWLRRWPSPNMQG